jgi:hypothetical protein
MSPMCPGSHPGRPPVALAGDRCYSIASRMALLRPYALRRALAGLLIAAWAWVPLAGCRVGKPQAPQAGDAGAAAVLQSYVGQARIVRHRSGQRSLSVKKAERVSGDCETAVVVRSAELARGTARLSLDAVGQPQGRQAAGCSKIIPGLRLEVSGFAAADTGETFRTSLDAVLQSPEAYLQARGVKFTPRPPDAPVKSDGRLFAPKVTSQPRMLLAVDPYHHDATGRVRYEGQLDFGATVGTDGRLQEPKLKTSLAALHEKTVLLALTLWRYEPAREGDRAVAVPIESRLVLRIR